MLRITVHEKSGALTFQLEGRLAGTWVGVLEECWQGALARQRKPILRVDLTEVTSIDTAGQAQLAAMHRQGAEFVAADCLTKAVVAEITRSEPEAGRAGRPRPLRRTRNLNLEEDFVMNATTKDLDTAVKTQAEKIVASGADIRHRLGEVVTQAASQAQQSGEGLVGLIRATIDGAREGLARSVPEDRDDVLRQVVDALGDGLSQTALAGQLAVQEGVSTSRQYTGEDLARLRDDLTAVRDLFAETVERGLKTCTALTAGQLSTARTHAERVAGSLEPRVTQALDAIRQHPLTFARESLETGVSMGQCAAGSLFQALGRMLQRAGDELRKDEG